MAAIILLAIAGSSGCGSYNNNTGLGVVGTITGGTSTGASGLNERAFVTNQNPNAGLAGLQIVDASKDLFAINSSSLTPFTITLGGTLPAQMFPGANNTTLVFDSGLNGISVVDNVKESLIGTEIALPGATDSVVATSDGKFAYASVRSTSQVVVLALTASPVTATALPAIPGAHRLVLSHNNSKLLVFSDDLDTFTVINTSDNSMQTVSGPGLDRPTFGVFSSDDSKVFVLNCGPECAGKQASVTPVDLTTTPPTVAQSVPVDAATVATSDATSLYVAGTGSAGGKLDVLGISNLAVSKSINIGDGFHNIMTIFDGKVLVGAQTCTTGCLSVVDPTAGSAVVDSPKGDVTAIAPITPRNSIFYVTEGGELRIYDAGSGAEQSDSQVSVTGKATSVEYVGPKT
jgi:hypothetical protein